VRWNDVEWKLDNNSPIYVQLVEIIKLKIVSSEMASGSKLSSVRDMAQEAGVNPNTMQKALAELERQGLVYSQRTSGRFVTEDKQKTEAMRKEIADLEINNLKEKLSKLGYLKNEIIELISENLTNS
jgi:DNA-binding transcriptional regulator YhcF (GntR family)